jgi:hypothetical protein
MADIKRERRQIDRDSVRGRCVKCGKLVVSECNYVSGKGYEIWWRCVGTVHQPPTCDYSERL